MTPKQIFARYIEIGKMMGEMFSPSLEVVIHDLRKPKESIIFVYNGSITGRKIGDVTTDLGRLRISDPKTPEALVGYDNKSPSGHRLKSSSLAIKNEKGSLIGSFCVNWDLTPFDQFESFMSAFLKTEPLSILNDGEDFGVNDAQKSIEDLVDEFIAERGWSSKQLSAEQRAEVANAMQEKGVFEKRGAASTLAQKLNVTRASIYNYLKD